MMPILMVATATTPDHINSASSPNSMFHCANAYGILQCTARNEYNASYKQYVKLEVKNVPHFKSNNLTVASPQV